MTGDRLAEIRDILSRGGDLKGNDLEKADLRHLHAVRPNLERAHLSQADLSGSHIFDGNFEGAVMIGADFSDSDLTNCDFRGADLTRANLSGARLWNSNFENAALTEANLSRTDLRNTNLHNIKLWHTDLKDAKSLSRRNFTRHPNLLWTAKINEDGLASAEEAYRGLKSYFLASGMYNDAGWASFKEKSIERFMMKRNRDPHYIPSVIMAILCGYGEKPARIVISALFTVLFYAMIYYVLGAVQNTQSPGYTVSWSDYIYYSAVTFTTVGYGDFLPKAHGLFRLLAASEAFLGVFLSGLFVFTLARRYSAR